jgi:hypothetical protein
MKEVGKKKSMLMSNSISGVKDNFLKPDRSSHRKNTHAPGGNIQIKYPVENVTQKRLSLHLDNGETRFFSESLKENSERKILPSNSFSQSNFNNTSNHTEVKTSQIKVVARFRPINMVEEVNGIKIRSSRKKPKANFASNFLVNRLYQF